MGFEVAIETGVDVARQLIAGQASQRLLETPVLRNQEVVVLVLQMEGVELKLDSCLRHKNKWMKRKKISVIKF